MVIHPYYCYILGGFHFRASCIVSSPAWIKKVKLLTESRVSNKKRASPLGPLLVFLLLIQFHSKKVIVPPGSLILGMHPSGIERFKVLNQYINDRRV